MLEARITKQYSDFKLDVDLEFGPGVTVLFGPSGSGKSLILRSVAGIVEPDEGKIVIEGEIVFARDQGVNVPSQLRRVGYVPQQYALFPHLNVVEQIAFGLERQPRSVVEARVQDLVRQMRLRGLEQRLPHELSGGQQQRVAVARALAIEPRVLLLDEPFSALDSVVRGKLIEDLLDLQQRLGITIVLVTHDFAEAYSLASRIAVVESGSVLQYGSKEDVFYRPASTTIARLSGIRNIFEGTVVGADLAGLAIEVDGAFRNFVVLAPPAPIEIGDRVRWCIRPESITLVRPERSDRSREDQVCLSGTIIREVDYGTVRTLFFKIGDEPPTGYRDYDLEILIGAPAYEVLGLREQKYWTVALKRTAIHVIERIANRTNSTAP